MYRQTIFAALLLAGVIAAVPALGQSSTDRASAASNSAATDRAPSAPHRRTRITIYPGRNEPGPNSKRQCRSWLEREYRVSGTVIVPRMHCWWD
jgi:hypothetical protein